MKSEEFYRKYANMPLANRNIVQIYMTPKGIMEKSPWEIYDELHRIDGEIDTLNERRMHLFELAKIIMK